MVKSKIVTCRFSESEYKNLKSKADTTGVSVSKLVRKSVLRIRTWTAKNKKIEQEKIRQLARIGNNLNQIARFCNTYKEGADSLEIVQHLILIECEIKKVLK